MMKRLTFKRIVTLSHYGCVFSLSLAKIGDIFRATARLNERKEWHLDARRINYTAYDLPE